MPCFSGPIHTGGVLPHWLWLMLLQINYYHSFSRKMFLHRIEQPWNIMPWVSWKQWIKENDKLFCRCILETCFQNACPFKALNCKILYLVITVLNLHCRKTCCSICPHCISELFPLEKSQHVEKKVFLQSDNSVLNCQSKLLLFLFPFNP